MKTKLEKFRVCDQCLCFGIQNTNCICSYGKYRIIELEFEVCGCCGHILHDGDPVDTAFNKKQFKEHNKTK